MGEEEVVGLCVRTYSMLLAESMYANQSRLSCEGLCNHCPNVVVSCPLLLKRPHAFLHRDHTRSAGLICFIGHNLLVELCKQSDPLRMLGLMLYPSARVMSANV